MNTTGAAEYRDKSYILWIVALGSTTGFPVVLLIFVVGKDIMHHELLFDEYENGYEGEYDGVYDQNFVFYDEDEEEEEGYNDESYDSDDDIVLEEVPFVYCPSRDEVAEA